MRDLRDVVKELRRMARDQVVGGLEGIDALNVAADILEGKVLPINPRDWEIIGGAAFITDVEKRKLLRTAELVVKVSGGGQTP